MSQDNQVPIPQAALDLIAEFELFRPDAYKDPTGRWTVGFGHTAGVTKDTRVDMDQAVRLRRLDAEGAVRDIYSLLRPPLQLDAGQWAGLIDFVFNLGAEDLRTSTLLAKLNRGDFAGAADEFHRWDHMHKETGEVVENARLRERRCRERDLFLDLEAGTSLKELLG